MIAAQIYISSKVELPQMTPHLTIVAAGKRDHPVQRAVRRIKVENIYWGCLG